MSGHELIREIIAKHGRDRYPTAELILLKLTEELGELVQAHLRWHAVTGDLTRVRKEYADVGLVLYGLGNKLGLDLEEEMAKVVAGETRKFG